MSKRCVALKVVIVTAVLTTTQVPFLSSVARGNAAEMAGPDPIPVTTVAAKTGTVPRVIAGIGVATALQSVTVRPRIDGAVKEIDFVEGDTVNAGDVLIRLDPRALQATLDGARAKKNQDQALLDNARADLERYTALADKKVVSSQDLDSKRSAAKQIEATMAADDASISSAETELSYATIRAPIGGRTGFKNISVGSVVSPSSTDRACPRIGGAGNVDRLDQEGQGGETEHRVEAGERTGKGIAPGYAAVKRGARHVARADLERVVEGIDDAHDAVGALRNVFGERHKANSGNVVFGIFGRHLPDDR